MPRQRPRPTAAEEPVSAYLGRIPEFTTAELYWLDSRRKVPADVQHRIRTKLARIKRAIRRERARWEASGNGPIYVEPPATP